MYRTMLFVIVLLMVSQVEMRTTSSRKNFDTASSIFLAMLLLAFLNITIILSDLNIAKWDMNTYLKMEKERISKIIETKPPANHD